MNRIILIVVVALTPYFVFASPVEQVQSKQVEDPMVVTIDGIRVNDETKLLKLLLMIQQAGITEPVIGVETVVRERLLRTKDGHVQVDAFTTIVTSMRFVERVISDHTESPLSREVNVAITASWKNALVALAGEIPVDITGTVVGRVMVDNEVVTDIVTITKLRIFIKKMGIIEPVRLIETRTQQHSLADDFSQVEAFSNIFTATRMIENVPSTTSSWWSKWWTRERSERTSRDEDRAKIAVAMESWKEALHRLAQQRGQRVRQ